MALAYLTPVDVPRSAVLVGVPLLAGTAFLGRYAHRRVLHRSRTQGQAMMRTIVVGDTASVSGVAHDLGIASHHGYLVIGACLSDVVPENLLEVPGADPRLARRRAAGGGRLRRVRRWSSPATP